MIDVRQDHVGVGDGLTGNGTTKWVVCKVSAAHSQRWNQAGKGDAFPLVLLLAIHKKEGLVVADGPTDGAAKLVQIELRSCGVKVAFGVEVSVANKLEERSVEVVGA